MIYILLWLTGVVAFLGLWHAARANGKIEQLIAANNATLDVHKCVAQILEEHHDRLEKLESPDFSLFEEPANDENYGGTSDED